MNFRYISKINKLRTCKIFCGIMWLMFVFVSCVNDDLYIPGISEDNDNIKIRGYVVPAEQTRGYYGSTSEQEAVTTGKWYFTYPMASNLSFSSAIYGTATVDFDASLEDPTIGFAKYTNDKGEEKDLKWKHIWTNTSTNYYYFYLHNINPEFYEDTYTADGSPARTRAYQKVSFKDSSPFKTIQPLDKEEGSNDIITGVCSFWSSDKNKDFVFELNHRLALFRLDIAVYPAEDNHLINLENAKVTINNIYTGLQSFSIYSPTSFSTTSTSSSNYYYGNYTKKDTFTIKGDSKNDGYDWEYVEDDPDYTYEGETYSRKIYHSYEFVVPPQTFSGTMPKFTVSVPKEDVTGSNDDEGQYVEYTGFLPSSMFNYVNGEMDPAPIATAFTGGTQLTVTASINSPETELHFSPVKVEAWISKGSFTISTNQAGIYNIDDFENMVEAYRQRNLGELEKYGYTTTDGTFIIQFWNNIEIPNILSDGESLDGCMPYDRNLNFAFMFNGCVIKLIKEDGEIEELENSSGQLELYGIVSGNKKNYTGVRSADDILKVIKLCSEDDVTADIHKLVQYGSISNSDNTFTLDICNSVEVDIKDIFQKLPTTFGGYNVGIAFADNNCELRIIFPDRPDEDENSAILSRADYPIGAEMIINSLNSDYLASKIVFVADTYGIYNNDDFEFLKECYNTYCKYYKDILKVFGRESQDTGQWTIYLRTDMTVKGEDFICKMTPDAEEGKPDFTFYSYNDSTRKYYTLTVEDEYTPISTTSSSYYVYMLKGNGKASYVSNIVTNYNYSSNYYLWQYGVFDRVTKKWRFPLTFAATGHSETWSSLYNKMIVNEENGKFDYEFDLTGITSFIISSMPKSSTNSSTSSVTFNVADDDGANVLKHICLGDYWEWLEQQTAGE